MKRIGQDVSETLAKIIIATQRNGPAGKTMLTFLRQWTKFDDLAPEHTSSEC